MLRFVLFLTTSLVIAVPGAGQHQEARAESIVLFGARWCAPCMAEYKDLPQLAKAAAPDRIDLAWIDRPIAPPAGLELVTGLIPADEARRNAERFAGVGYGLPFSVMTDGHGHACALWRHPLASADLAQFRQLCRTGVTK